MKHVEDRVGCCDARALGLLAFQSLAILLVVLDPLLRSQNQSQCLVIQLCGLIDVSLLIKMS